MINPSPPTAPVARNPLVRYLAGLSAGRLVLWFYFIHWLAITVRYFDPRPRLWLTSAGLSLIIGLALYINTVGSGRDRVRLSRWATFRLFLTPFCVSSFAALVKDLGFFLIFSPRPADTFLVVAACVGLAVATATAKRLAGTQAGRTDIGAAQ